MMASKRDEADKKEGREKCRCYADERLRNLLAVRTVSHPLRYYEFTEDEMKALEQCDRESFYQRCLPFSTILATLTYAAIKKGLVRRHPHWGAVPAVMVAFLSGHLLGRFSYSSQCDARLRALPQTSFLGDNRREYYLQNHPPKK